MHAPLKYLTVFTFHNSNAVFALVMIVPVFNALLYRCCRYSTGALHQWCSGGWCIIAPMCLLVLLAPRCLLVLHQGACSYWLHPCACSYCTWVLARIACTRDGCLLVLHRGACLSAQSATGLTALGDCYASTFHFPLNRYHHRPWLFFIAIDTSLIMSWIALL